MISKNLIYQFNAIIVSSIVQVKCADILDWNSDKTLRTKSGIFLDDTSGVVRTELPQGSVRWTITKANKIPVQNEEHLKEICSQDIRTPVQVIICFFNIV